MVNYKSCIETYIHKITPSLNKLMLFIPSVMAIKHCGSQRNFWEVIKYSCEHTSIHQKSCLSLNENICTSVILKTGIQVGQMVTELKT